MPACGREATRGEPTRRRRRRGRAARRSSSRCWCSPASCWRRGSSTSSPRASRARSARPRRGWCGFCFPGAGLLVLSAWCLGVLNSHRRFFLSYAAPVVWNLAIIAALLAYGCGTAQLRAGGSRRVGLGGGQPAPVRACSFRRCSGCSAGCGLGPLLDCVRCGPSSATSCRCSSAAAWCRSARTSTRVLASLLPTGAVAAVSYAQVLYTLPVSLFGMSVSAAELPEMSSAVGTATRSAPAYLRERLEARAAADRVLRRSVGGGVHRAGRRRDRCALPVGRVHPRDDGVRVGHPGGGFGRPARRRRSGGSTPRRSTRCTTPARRSGSRWCGCASAIALGYALALHLPAAARRGSAVGSGGHHARLGARRRRRISAAAARARRTDRARRDSTGGTLGAALGSGARRQGALAWAIRLARCRRCIRSRVAVIVLGVFGAVYLGGAAALLGVPQARRLLRRCVSPTLRPAIAVKFPFV